MLRRLAPLLVVLPPVYRSGFDLLWVGSGWCSGCCAFGAAFLGGIGVERFRGVLLLWEVLTPVFPVFQLFGKLKDRVNVMPSARAARAARGWPVRKSSNEVYTVSGKLTKTDYVFYIVGMMPM